MRKTIITCDRCETELKQGAKTFVITISTDDFDDLKKYELCMGCLPEFRTFIRNESPKFEVNPAMTPTLAAITVRLLAALADAGEVH